MRRLTIIPRPSRDAPGTPRAPTGLRIGIRLAGGRVRVLRYDTGPGSLDRPPVALLPLQRVCRTTLRGSFRTAKARSVKMPKP